MTIAKLILFIRFDKKKKRVLTLSQGRFFRPCLFCTDFGRPVTLDPMLSNLMICMGLLRFVCVPHCADGRRHREGWKKKESAGGTGAFGERKNGGENQDFGSRSARSASPGYSARNSDSPIRKRVRRGEEARTASMSARVFTPESEMSVVVSGK